MRSYVETAAIGCPAKAKPSGSGSTARHSSRPKLRLLYPEQDRGASLRRTAEGGCPHMKISAGSQRRKRCATHQLHTKLEMLACTNIPLAPQAEERAAPWRQLKLAIRQCRANTKFQPLQPTADLICIKQPDPVHLAYSAIAALNLPECFDLANQSSRTLIFFRLD